MAKLWQAIRQLLCGHPQTAGFDEWRERVLLTGDLRVWCAHCGWLGPNRPDDRATESQLAYMRGLK